MRGRFFHLCLRNIYNEPNDDTHRINIRMISALAFVPLNFIVWAFERLCQHCGNAEQPILQYLESNCIGEIRAGVRVAPRFGMSTIVLLLACRVPPTPLEGGIMHFKCGTSHANIWTFITFLKNENAGMHLKIAQDIGGIPATAQKPTYRQLTDRIRNIVTDFGNRNIYLRAYHI